MNEMIRDRMNLLIAAIVVSVGLSVLGYVSYAVGLGNMGVLLILQTASVFAGVLWYCATAWPKWYRRRVLRTRIILTYVTVFGVHLAIVALNFRRFRFEWGMWAWGAASLAEMFVIVVAITAVVVRPE